jgi:hypothetical protein
MGRSFWCNGEPAEYRVNRRACLPKFNDGKNPFMSKAPAAAEEPAVVKAAASGPKAPPPYAFKPVKTARRGFAAVPPSAPAPALARQVPAKAARPGWTTRLNPFRAPEPEPAQAPAVVQAELSLDAVRVVHNDLSDADVEVVPMKAHAQAVVSAPVLPATRRAFEFVGENLMRS